MPIFVGQYLRTHKLAQSEHRLRSVAWAEADYVFDRGGRSTDAPTVGVSPVQQVRGRDRARRRPVPRLAPCYATRLLERVHPNVVSEALGHSSISITLDTYSHVIPSMSQVAADAIDAVLGE
jgi:integrase